MKTAAVLFSPAKGSVRASATHNPSSHRTCAKSRAGPVNSNVSTPMTKRSKLANLFCCPVCNRKLPEGQDSLSRHFRIDHGREMTPFECNQLLTNGLTEIPTTAAKLPALKFITRSPVALERWVFCDRCYTIAHCWHFKNTTRGEMTLCEKCIGQFKPTKKLDALDAKGHRAHGSYGG